MLADGLALLPVPVPVPVPVPPVVELKSALSVPQAAKLNASRMDAANFVFLVTFMNSSPGSALIAEHVFRVEFTQAVERPIERICGALLRNCAEVLAMF
jgi:hypothetical protein